MAFFCFRSKQGVVKSDCLSQTLYQLCRGLVHRSSLLPSGRATEPTSAQAYVPVLGPRGSPCK